MPWGKARSLFSPHLEMRHPSALTNLEPDLCGVGIFGTVIQSSRRSSFFCELFLGREVWEFLPLLHAPDVSQISVANVFSCRRFYLLLSDSQGQRFRFSFSSRLGYVVGTIFPLPTPFLTVKHFHPPLNMIYLCSFSSISLDTFFGSVFFSGGTKNSFVMIDK